MSLNRGMRLRRPRVSLSLCAPPPFISHSWGQLRPKHRPVLFENGRRVTSIRLPAIVDGNAHVPAHGSWHCGSRSLLLLCGRGSHHRYVRPRRHGDPDSFPLRCLRPYGYGEIGLRGFRARCIRGGCSLRVNEIWSAARVCVHAAFPRGVVCINPQVLCMRPGVGG